VRRSWSGDTRSSQNLRRGHYEVGIEARHPILRLATAFDQLAPTVKRLGALEPDSPELHAVAKEWAAVVGLTEDSTERAARQTAVAAAQEEVDRIIRLVAKGVGDEDEAARALPGLRATLRTATARLAELAPPEADISGLLDLAASGETGPLAEGSAWDSLAHERRREVVRAVVRRITVALRGRHEGRGRTPPYRVGRRLGGDPWRAGRPWGDGAE
jgi:hypothetical protein